MERKFVFATDEFYHIYNRGTEKREIFLNQTDYQRFLESLYLFNSNERVVLKMVPKSERFVYERGETIVDIGAYCLMPNHFHLLIRSKSDQGTSNFMKKLQTAYSMYFNKKYKRTGSLFQGPFRAEHIKRDEYLKYLFSYIHLNPIKMIDKNWKEAGIRDFQGSKDFLLKWQFSSHPDYLGENRKQMTILNKTPFPEYFQTIKDFKDFIDFWLTFKNGIEKYT